MNVERPGVNPAFPGSVGIKRLMNSNRDIYVYLFRDRFPPTSSFNVYRILFYVDVMTILQLKIKDSCMFPHTVSAVLKNGSFNVKNAFL